MTGRLQVNRFVDGEVCVVRAAEVISLDDRERKGFERLKADTSLFELMAEPSGRQRQAGVPT